MPRSRNFHGLKKLGGGKIRQTWNKYNLYNLWRLQKISDYGTYFQQKWKAKSATRAYHGEQVLEKHWQRMFRSRIRSVIPMSHKYLAMHDGSELAAGRGSGREQKRNPNARKEKFPTHIPHMSMTYAPMERRLDTAIFRSLFASSARQARQFVVHGKVKVNGKKMPYPGYMLNPGDMFQVDPEAVMFATGAPKEQESVRAGRRLKRIKRHEARQAALQQEAAQKRAKKAREAAQQKALEEVAEQEEVAAKAAALKAEKEDMDDDQRRKVQRKQINGLIETAQVLTRDTRNAPSAKRKQELRAFIKSAKEVSNKSQRKTVEEFEKSVEELVSSFALLTPTPPTKESAAEIEASKTPIEKTEAYRTAYQESLNAIMQARIEATDDTKPYATPWRPRPYMSAFAFIPRYLEVNQNICSAVYLRHPVARPVIAEVPSPFAEEAHQLAFNWYLSRR